MASIRKRDNGKWRARYRDEAGREHAKHFERKVDAQRWLDEVTASVVTGSYVDPKAGRITFARFYQDWSARQLWVPSTRVNADRVARTVPFADMPMKAIRRSHVEQWVKQMNASGLAATTVKTRSNVLRGDHAGRGRRPGDFGGSEHRGRAPPPTFARGRDDGPD